MNRSFPSLVAALLVAALPAAATSQDAVHTAPDGRPGLGTTREVQEYARLLRKPEDEAEMLEGLRGLPGELAVLVDGLEQEARDEGYFALLEGDDPETFDGLRARFALLEADPLPTLTAGKKRGEALARAWLDLGFRLRLEALEGYEEDARDVRAGLALMQGINDGFVNLRLAEAQEIARRVDLGAALLRARRMDLEALTPRGKDAPGRPEAAWVAELIGVASTEDELQRQAGFDTLRRKVDARAERLRTGLFTPRLREGLLLVLGQRAAARDEARRRLRQLLPLLPETEQGADPGPEIEGMPKMHRYAVALRLAVEGLSFDVFDEELCYYAGLAADFYRTRLESRAWFDRYLALRGIRSHDGRTYRKKKIGRDLTDEESYALSIVQQAGGLLGR